MSDDLAQRGPADASRINTHEKWEVEYWSHKFHVTPEELKAAVAQVGHTAVSVEAYLHQGRKA